MKYQTATTTSAAFILCLIVASCNAFQSNTNTKSTNKNIIANHNEETSLYGRTKSIRTHSFSYYTPFYIDNKNKRDYHINNDPMNLYHNPLLESNNDYNLGRRKSSSSSELSATAGATAIATGAFDYNYAGYGATATATATGWIDGLYDQQQKTKTAETETTTNNNLLHNTIKPIISTSLLITGNTIGAGALVLPDIVQQGPGLVISTGIFLGSYVINLISGLLLAEVAIKQYESSQSSSTSTNGGDDVPSSFKEFAENNLPGSSPAIVVNGIAGVSMFVNACVLAFNLVHVGGVLSAPTITNTLQVDPTFISLGFAAALTALFVLVDMEMLSSIASMAVTGLFVTLGSLLLPGLANISDPINTFFNTMPTAAVADVADAASTSSMMESITHAAPIILTSMVYQNIVPSVTKILNYDRFKSTASIVIGSAIPTIIYFLWCFVNIGGGLDSGEALGGGGALMTAFSLTTIIGSSIACVMSISEEVESLFFNKNKKDNNDDTITNIEEEEEQQRRDNAVDDNGGGGGKGIFYSTPSVCLSVLVPLSVGMSFACSGGGNNDCINDMLRYAGSYGSPLLYGFLPVVMAYTQREKLSSFIDTNNNIQNLVPGGIVSLGLLGLTSGSFMFDQMIQDFGNVVSQFA